MDKLFHPTLYDERNYLSMLIFKLIHMGCQMNIYSAFTDIGNSNIGKSFSYIGKSSHFPISEIQINDIRNSNFRYRKIEFPMSENHLDLPISENHPIYRYRKSFWFSWFSYIGKSVDLLISEIRISDIGNSAWSSDIGKSTDLPISKIQLSDIGNSKRFSDIGKSTDLPISEIRFSILYR